MMGQISPFAARDSATTVAALFARFLPTSGRSDFSVALIVGYGLRSSRKRPGHDRPMRAARITASGSAGLLAKSKLQFSCCMLVTSDHRQGWLPPAH